MMLSAIVDHSVLHDTIPKSQVTYVNSYGVNRRKTTTRGWKLLVEWRDESSDWVALKDLKESYPIKLAMYAKERKVDDEPAFAWWVPCHTSCGSRNVYCRRSKASTGQELTIMVFVFQIM